jgi:hypothetical protein
MTKEATLTLKPFGASGVRLVYCGVGVIEVQPLEGGPWLEHAPVTDTDGVLAVKTLTDTCSSTAPRAASWRLRSNQSGDPDTTPPVRLPQPARGGQAFAARRANAATVPLDDAELAFNILQWYGTICVDGRATPPSRLVESVVCLRTESAAAVALKDDAVVIGLSDDVAAALAGRVRNTIHALTPRALAEMEERWPWLCFRTDALAPGALGQPASNSEQKRPVLPNLVDGTLLVGHQVRAPCAALAPSA